MADETNDQARKQALLKRMLPHRQKWDPHFRPEGLEVPGPGEQSVWDYPRPPIVVRAPVSVRVCLGETLIAQSDASLEVRETAGAPVPYLPPSDVKMDWLVASGLVTHCEWKGEAISYDLCLPSGERIADAAWAYPDPFDDLAEGYRQIAGFIAFYPAKLDCFVAHDGHATGGRDTLWERVRAQPGGLYGGWVSDRIKGPIKGAPGTEHW